MPVIHEWSSVGLFLGSVWNAGGLLVGGAVLAGLLLFAETMMLRRTPSLLGYAIILVLCIVSACFVAWQEQYLLARDNEEKLQSSDRDKATLAAQVDELSKLVDRQNEVLNAKSGAMTSLETQYQTAQRTLATEKEKHQSTYARARLASLRAEGLRLSQKVLANPNEPTPDLEFWAWSQATERTLYTLFQPGQVHEFNEATDAALTYAKNYYDEYLSRSGGVLVEEESKEIQSRLIALFISAQVATLEKFSRNLRTLRLKN